MMKVDDRPYLIADDKGVVCGMVTHWNPHGTKEVIVQYFDGSGSSEYFGDLTFPNGAEKAREYLNSKEP